MIRTSKSPKAVAMVDPISTLVYFLNMFDYIIFFRFL